MSLHPTTGGPVLDRLAPADAPEVLSFLEDDPELNVYLIALVLRDALARATDAWWGVRRDGRLTGVAFLGGQSGAVLLAGDDAAGFEALGATLPTPAGARLQVIGPRRALSALRHAFPGAPHRPRLDRDQTYLVLGPGALPPREPLPELRTARREDYAFLYHAGADLRAEELLEDPREVDPANFAQRVEEECRDGWTWVWRDVRGLVFRAGISALTRDAAQVSGVWVPPAHRGQGIATRALGELCARLQQRSRAVTLFVNDVNTPALALYRRLGFTPRAAWGSAFYERA